MGAWCLAQGEGMKPWLKPLEPAEIPKDVQKLLQVRRDLYAQIVVTNELISKAAKAHDLVYDCGVVHKRMDGW